MSINNLFTKEKIEIYLKELGKEFRKRGKGIAAELILVGGASVIINYAFRQSSFDVDAFYNYPSIMKESINAVGDRFNLPNGWLNDDFKKTKSFTYKILEYSKYYKTFSGVLMVRTVESEYLVAMKLVSGRKYKSDLSDIAGIIYEKNIEGNPLSFEKIDKAVCNLYGSWDLISNETIDVLKRILNSSNYKKILDELNDEQLYSKTVLTEVIENKVEVVNSDNVNDVISAAIQKKNSNK